MVTVRGPAQLSSSTLSPVTAHNLWTPGGLRQGVQEETIYFPPYQPSTGYVVIRQKINFLHDVKKSPITVWLGELGDTWSRGGCSETRGGGCVITAIILQHFTKFGWTQ